MYFGLPLHVQKALFIIPLTLLGLFHLSKESRCLWQHCSRIGSVLFLVSIGGRCVFRGSYRGILVTRD